MKHHGEYYFKNRTGVTLNNDVTVYGNCSYIRTVTKQLCGSANTGSAVSRFISFTHNFPLDFSPNFRAKNIIMESNSSASTQVSPERRGSEHSRESFAADYGPSQPTPLTAATIGADDLARLHELRLNEDNHLSSDPSPTASMGEVSLTRQSSILNYFTPRSLSPTPAFMFADTPVTVNQSIPKPRPARAPEHGFDIRSPIITSTDTVIDTTLDTNNVPINQNMINLSPETLAKRLSVGLQEYAASILPTTRHKHDDVIHASSDQATPTAGNYSDEPTTMPITSPISLTDDSNSSIHLAPYRLTSKRDTNLKTYEFTDKFKRPVKLNKERTPRPSATAPPIVGINTITPPPSSENVNINFHYGAPNAGEKIKRNPQFNLTNTDFPNMPPVSPPIPPPKPQRTTNPSRTRRERMANSSPPPALYDPDLSKFETALRNIRSFEEALFWDDDSQTNYSPDPSLYPDTSGSKLWLDETQTLDHAKRSYLNQKMNRLTTSDIHTVTINPIDTAAKQNSIRSYLVNNPPLPISTTEKLIDIPPRNNDHNEHLTVHHNVTNPTQSLNNTENPPKRPPPLTVTFTVDENTDTHARATFVPQVPMDQTPSFIANDQPVGTLGSQVHEPRPMHNPTYNATPTPAATILPEQQPGNLKQSYYAEILPDALEVWKSYRNASQREGSCRIRAGYMRYLARSGRFPTWTSTMMPPAGMITTMDASLRIVSHRRQQSISTLNLMASILEDKAINHKTSVDLYKEGLKQRYLDYTPYPGSTIDYNYQIALDVAKNLVDRDYAELNQKLNADAAILKQNPENALWTGIEHKFRPRSQTVGHPETQYQNATQNQQQPTTIRGNNLTPVSPLMNAEHQNHPMAPNQIFQTAWGQMGRRQPRGANTGRRRPYNQSSSTGRQYQDPQYSQYEISGHNQGYQYQNPNSRRRGRREYQPQPRDNRQDTRESDLMTMLKKFVEKY